MLIVYLVLQPAPAPYRIALFQRLSIADSIHLLYVGHLDDGRKWRRNHGRLSWSNLASRRTICAFGKRVSFGFGGARKYVQMSRAIVLCTNLPELQIYLTFLFWAKVLRRPVVCLVSIDGEYRYFRGEGIFADLANGLCRALVSVLVKRSDNCIAYTRSGQKFALRLGTACCVPAQYYPLYEEYGYISSTHVIDRATLQLSSTRRTLSIIGYISERKGVLEFLRALHNAKLLQSFSIIIAGSVVGTASFEADIRAFEADGVSLVGHLDELEKRRLLSRSDFMVFPTLHDSWGHVVIEAMYCGVPVIASLRSGVAVDVIRDGINGFVYDNDAALCHLLRHLPSDKAYTSLALQAHDDAVKLTMKSIEAWERVFATTKG